MDKRSVATVKAEKPTLTHALDKHVSTLTIFRKTLKTSTLAVTAIPAQFKMIKERKALMKEHLHEAIFKLCNAIKKSKTIGGVPDDGWVHWEGGSFWSGEAHAECIIRAMVTQNTLTIQLDFATMLGV